MNRNLFVVAFITALVGAAPAPARDLTMLKIATEGSAPPWNAVDASGQLVGFDVDVGKELCRRMAAKCSFVAQDWDGIIPALTVGKYDAIIAAMAITEKRKKSIAFSIPYAVGFNQIIMRKDLGLPATDPTEKLNLTHIDAAKQATLDKLRAALSGRTLGVLRSSNSEVVLNELFGKNATIRTYESNESLTLDLVAGRIDGGLADFFVWKTFLAGKDGGVAAFYGPMLNGGTWGPGVGVGIRQADTELVDAFNKAIESARQDGTLKRLTEQWFGMDMSPPAN